jgi:hypothetical protein
MMHAVMSDELIKLIDRCFFVFSYFPVFVIQKWIIRTDYLPDNPMDTPGFNLLRPSKGLCKSSSEYFHIFPFVHGSSFTLGETDLLPGLMICRDLFMVSAN